MNISKYRIIFVDFDDTLCIHSKETKDSPNPRTSKYIYSKPNRVLKQILQECKRNHTMIYCVTMIGQMTEVAIKRQFLEDKYPGIFSDCIGVLENTEKELVMDNMITSEISRKDILLIDDHPAVRIHMREVGFASVSPLYLVAEKLRW